MGAVTRDMPISVHINLMLLRASLSRPLLEKFTRSDEPAKALVARAHEAGELRADATAVDVSLLIEQLGKASLVEQFEGQRRTGLADAASSARQRTIAIALDGLRTGHGPLPGRPPAPDLLAERW